MANTYVDYTATAAQQYFAFNFPYLEDEHVIVEIEGVDQTIATNYTIETSPSQRINLSNPTTALAGGELVRIKRRSAPNTNLVDFVNGSVLTESELDRAYLHNRYLAEEATEGADSGLKELEGSTNFNANNKQIKNLADGTLATDAVNKQYVDTQIALTDTNLAGFYKSTHTGNAVDNVFTLSFTPQTTEAEAYIVSIDGLVQVPDTDYTIGATAITFNTIPSNSAEICVVATAAASVATVNEAQVTATGSTAARSLADRFADVVNVLDFIPPSQHADIKDGTTTYDATDDIQAAINAANTLNKSLEFTNGTYVINGTGNLFTLDGLRGCIIHGNGATLLFKDNSSSPTCNVFYITNCTSVTFKDINIKSNYVSYPWNTTPNDIQAFYSYGVNNNLIFSNIYGENLKSLFVAVNDGTYSNRASNLVFENIRTLSVYYVFNFQDSGDRVKISNADCLNTGRVYFPYGVRHHEVDIRSQHGGPFSDCLIKVYENSTENINLKYTSIRRWSNNRFQSYGESLIAVEIQSDTSKTIKNINIDADVYADALVADYRPQSLFTTKKWTAAGAIDTSTLKHYIINLQLSGVIRYNTQFKDDPIRVAPTGYGNWSNSEFINWSFNTLVLPDVGSTNNAVTFDNSNYPSGYPLRVINSYTDGIIDLTNIDIADSKINGIPYSLYNSASKLILGQNSLLFPATQVPSSNPNALDDYEEGEFTPTIYGTSTAGEATYVSSGRVARYTKVGNRVHFTIYLSWTAHTGSGNMHISGLPFNSKNVVNLYHPVTAYYQNLDLTASYFFQGYIPNNNNVIFLFQQPVGTGSSNLIPLDTSAQLIINGSYETE